MSRANLGNKTLLADANDGSTTEAWVKGEHFVGLDGSCTIKGYGDWGGATLTLEIADDELGTGAQTIENSTFTGNFSKVLSISQFDYVRVVTSGGSESAITVTATPHGRR
jgi:hypothetical protein